MLAETFEHPASACRFWVAVLRIATPLILGTLGVLLCERAGVLNLGIEGIMVAGAFTGWLAVYHGAGLWTGVAVAALAGAAFGLLHALLTVTLGAVAACVGLGITLFATSLACYAYRVSFPKVTARRHRALRRDGLAADPGAERADAADAAGAAAGAGDRPGCCTARRLGWRCAWSARTRPPPKARA